jgi:ADP-heptose:LPS heptosyltransferase
MTPLVEFLRSFKLAVDLVNQFYSAWISWELAQIKENLEKKDLARKHIIAGIDQAIKERDREKLIALNHALAIVERGKL